MNKILRKIATGIVGIAMAIGVGVAIGGGAKDVRSVKAASTTYTFTTKAWDDSTHSWTSDKDASQMNSGYVQVTTSYSDAGATSKSSFTNVSNVTITFHTNASKGTGSVSVKIGSNTATSKSVTASGGTTDRTLSYDYATNQTGTVSFTVTCSENSIYVKSIAITTNEGGGGTAPDGAASSTSFSTTGKYVLCGTNSNTKYYLNSVSTFNANADWGVCTTTESLGYRFSLSGSTASGSTTIQASTVINNTTYYLKPLSTGKFHLTSTTSSLTLKQDGTIYNPTSGSTSYNLRYNYNNGSGGFRWYSSNTGSSGYFMEANCTISYNSNGGSGSMSSTTGTNPAVASCSFTAPTGYHFDHWNTASNDTGATYAVGATPKTDLALFAIWAKNTYSVGGTINNGSLSSTASVSHGAALSITINANSGYKRPTELTKVTMGGVTLNVGSGYNYDSSNGAFSIASVTGNVVINATCPLDVTTHKISGTITNGGLTGDTGDQVEGGDYTVQISPSNLYKYPTSVLVSGAGVEDEGWEYDADYGIVYIYGLAADVTITATCPAASITKITVTGQKSSFVLGESFSFGGTVKANYDDVAGSTNVTISTDLVEIDDNDFDPFTETNSHTIDVTLKSDDSVSTSYTVSVAKRTISTTTTYDLVTASKSDWSGKYVILSAGSTDSSGYVLGNAQVNSTTYRINNGTRPTISGDSITAGYANYVYTITKSGNYYLVSPDAGDNAGKYLAGRNEAKNTATFISDSTSNFAKWTISYSNGVFDMVNYGVTQKTSDTDNAYLRNNTTNGWACYLTGTGTKPALYEKVETPSGVRSLIRLTATGPAANVKVEDDEVYASDFVATALFDTAENETVTPTIVSVNGSGPTTKLVQGTNTVVLSYTDPNDGTNTKSYEITVIAAENTAELDGITWNKEAIEITQFEGTTIVYGTLHKHYDDDTSIVLEITECTVAVYTKSGLVFTKDHDISSPTTYTFDLEDDNGKYLGVTYSGYTLYSGKINVVENLEAVYNKVENTIYDEKITSVSLGDKVVFAAVYESINYRTDEYNTTNNLITTQTYTGTYPDGGIEFTIGSDGNENYTFYNSTLGYLMYNKQTTTKGNEIFFVDSLDTTNYTTSWTIDFDESDNAVIKNVYSMANESSDDDRTIQYNYNQGNPRFACYRTEQTPIQLYKGRTEWDPTGSNIANTNAVVQKAVLDYADHFNDYMSCVMAGTTADVSSKWDDLSDDFDDLLAEFSESETNLEHCKALFAGADAVDGGDTLQDMLARYEYICAKYELDDFLHEEADRPPVSKRTHFSPFANLGVNANTALIIVITSVVTGLAIGGYFFLRKKKED